MEDLLHLAQHKRFVGNHGGGVDVANVDGRVAGEQLRHGQYQIFGVGGAEDLHGGNAAHQRHVFDGLVGGAVAVGQQASHATNQFDGQVGDADVGAHKFEGAHGQKGGERVADGNASAHGEPGRHADHRLFGDAGVDEAVAQHGGQVADGGAILGRHHDDAFVGQGKVFEGFFVTHDVVWLANHKRLGGDLGRVRAR